MDFDTEIAAADPVRRIPLDDPESPQATRLYQSITSERRPGRRRTRRILLPVVAGAAAAGLAAGVVIALQPGVKPGPATSTVRLTARQVLDDAAAAALTKPGTAPGADQFFYAKLKITGSGTSDGISQYWLSIDGERNGLEKVGSSGSTVEEGCVDGRQKVDTALKGGGYTGSSWAACTPVPAYLPDMPTAQNALLSYLRRTQGVGVSKPGLPANAFINSLGKAIDGLFISDWLSPAQQAALYRLAAQAPGMTVVRRVTDVDGRPGIGVEWRYQGLTTMLIFDAKTYQFLGLTAQDGGGTDSGMALLTTGVVNQVGDLP
jgi:hypothetical protein